MEIFERIRYIRESKGMTRKSFGMELGISGDVVNNIESNRLKRPEQKEPIYKLICEKFSVNEEWLLYGTGDMYKAVNDETASFIADLLIDVDNPFYSVIESILKTYSDLDDKSKKVLEDFSKQFIKNIKNDG